jgi:hypothetical protein
MWKVWDDEGKQTEGISFFYVQGSALDLLSGWRDTLKAKERNLKIIRIC